MAEPTPTTSGATALVADAMRRNRRPLTAALGVCRGSLRRRPHAIPVGLPDAGDPNTRGSLAGQPTTLAPAEDLAAFSASRRWGGDTFAELEARRRAAEANANADAARRDRMGFVGTSATPDDRVVLLTLPGGEVRRVPAGGTLPDGRTVSDVTDTTATLSDTGTGDQELELFPRPPAEAEGVVGEGLVPSRPKEPAPKA